MAVSMEIICIWGKSVIELSENKVSIQSLSCRAPKHRQRVKNTKG